MGMPGGTPFNRIDHRLLKIRSEETKMRLTEKNIKAQGDTTEKLIHWTGAPTGTCARKDQIDQFLGRVNGRGPLTTPDNITKETPHPIDIELFFREDGSYQGASLGLAGYYGNITCLKCRKVAWAAGVR